MKKKPARIIHHHRPAPAEPVEQGPDLHDLAITIARENGDYKVKFSSDPQREEYIEKWTRKNS
jgi:sugar lactone lactonase YvrE